MQVVLNGKTQTLSDISTVEDLINQLGLKGRLAIEINRQIIPRSKYTSHRINPGDAIEIVRAIGGGQGQYQH